MFSSEKKKQKKADAEIARNVDTYLARIETIVGSHERLNRKAEKAIQQLEKKPKSSQSLYDELNEYATERNELKNRFIQLKATCKENISRISETQVQQEKNDSLSKLLERYREIRASFKDLGVDDYAQRSHRNELFKGRGLSKQSSKQPGQKDNDRLLNEASGTARDTTAKLRQGLNDVQESQATAEQVALTLQEDREKIQNITHNLDEVESDLTISSRLVTRFMKRLYTDKIVIALTCLIACAVLAIIIYQIVD